MNLVENRAQFGFFWLHGWGAGPWRAIPGRFGHHRVSSSLELIPLARVLVVLSAGGLKQRHLCPVRRDQDQQSVRVRALPCHGRRCCLTRTPASLVDSSRCITASAEQPRAHACLMLFGSGLTSRVLSDSSELGSRKRSDEPCACVSFLGRWTRQRS